METVTNFIFLGSKVTADDACNHKLKDACSLEEKLWQTCVLVVQSCLTVCDPMDCSSPGFSVHGIHQIRILEWVAIPSSRDLHNPGIEPGSPTLQDDSLLSEPPGKPVTNLGSILKIRDITLLTKVCIVKAMVFPVVMYGCESWTIKKAEHLRFDAFELWCCGRLLRVPWTARRSNQSILKEISPEYSLKWLMLKLKF